MARKRDDGALGDLIEIVSLLPWWVGVLLAVLSYALLHYFATAEAPIITASGMSPQQVAQQVPQLITGQLGKTAAQVGQFVLPILLLLGALVSFVRGRRRKQLVQEASATGGASLRAMSWQDFERLVGEVFRLKGYAVLETGGGGADGGIDLQLRRGTEIFLVQCKHWKAYKVSVTVVRELYGVMVAQGAAGGLRGHLGGFHCRCS